MGSRSGSYRRLTPPVGDPVAKSVLRHVNDHGEVYDALAFVCPGCQTQGYGTGLHMLPINSPTHQPSWEWDGNLERPTLSPSILTNSTWKGEPTVCHSFLKEGVF